MYTASFFIVTKGTFESLFYLCNLRFFSDKLDLFSILIPKERINVKNSNINGVEEIDYMELYRKFSKHKANKYKLEDIASAELIVDVNENCVDIDAPVNMKAIREYCEQNATKIAEFEFQLREAMEDRR